MTNIYWSEARKPHNSSLKNLRKMSRYMMENGYTSPISYVSARHISLQVGITYNQVLNLINRPGFVKVSGTGKYQSMGWYYLPEFGIEYPENLPTGDILREIAPSKPEPVASVNNHPAVANVAEQLLKPGQMIIDLSPRTGSFTSKDFAQTTLQLLAAVTKGERTVKQAAEWMYSIAEGFHNGSLTLKD